MQKEKIQCAQDWVKKNIVMLIVMVEIAFVIITFVAYHNETKALSTYDFTSEQFLTQHIDGTFGEGLISITDDFLVKKGYYIYSVEYEGIAGETSIYPYSYIDYYDKAELKECYFREGNSKREYGLWINADLWIRFYVWHEGEGEVQINAIHLKETPLQARKELFGSMVCLVMANVFLFMYYYHKKHRIAVSSQYVFAGLLVISLAASYPILAGHAIAGHDLEFHLVRIEGIKDGLLAGQFPVRINPDFYCGYGYANSIMYGELLLYFPALLRLVGFSLTGAYCMYVLLVNMLTAFCAYWCFRRLLQDQLTGVIAAFMYVMAPYRLIDIYLRAAVGEYSAMIFLPLLTYGLYGIYTENPEEGSFRYRFVPLMIGLTGIIQTHVLTGEMAAVFIMLTCVVMIRRTFCRKRFWELVKSVGAAVLLNAWFLVPFIDYYITQDMKILQMKNVSKIRSTGANLTQITSLFSRFTLDGAEMPLTLGMALVLGMILCVVMLWVTGKEERRIKWSACFFLSAGVLAAWMATVYFPWDSLSDRLGRLGELLLRVQFVWRYLGMAVLFGSIATGFGLIMLKRKEGKQIFAVAAEMLCVLAAISGIYFLYGCVDIGVSIDISDLDGINIQVAAKGEEYVLQEMDYDVFTEIQEARADGGVVIENYEKQGTKIAFHAENDASEGYVLLPLQAYKGYRLKSSDGSLGREHLTEGPDAVVQVNIPGGFSGDIEVRFAGFWYWRLAEAVSVCTLAVLLLYGWRLRRREKAFAPNTI